MLQYIHLHASPCIFPQRLGAGCKANPRPALLQASHCLRRKVRARNIDRYIVHILKVRLTDLCVDMIGIVDWGLLCAMMGHVVIFIAPVHSTKIVIL